MYSIREPPKEERRPFSLFHWPSLPLLNAVVLTMLNVLFEVENLARPSPNFFAIPLLLFKPNPPGQVAPQKVV